MLVRARQSRHLGRARFALPLAPGRSPARVLRALDAAGPALGITAYGLSLPTLEQVGHTLRCFLLFCLFLHIMRSKTIVLRCLRISMCLPRPCSLSRAYSAPLSLSRMTCWS